MIAFSILPPCSLGVPARNELHLAGLPIPASLAPEDLAARLPQRMLAQGALAAIGHLDLVFAYSFREGQGEVPANPDPPPLYAECLRGLLRGLPVGEALDPFRACYQARLVERPPCFPLFEFCFRPLYQFNIVYLALIITRVFRYTQAWL